jgi:hypothetical protein
VVWGFVKTMVSSISPVTCRKLTSGRVIDDFNPRNWTWNRLGGYNDDNLNLVDIGIGEIAFIHPFLSTCVSGCQLFRSVQNLPPESIHNEERKRNEEHGRSL